MKVDYKRLYSDFISEKYPEKMILFENILSKEELTILDILKMNEILFKNNTENQKFRSYSKESILKILDYQQKNNLNNTDLSKHFKISRNTIQKWKKHFGV